MIFFFNIRNGLWWLTSDSIKYGLTLWIINVGLRMLKKFYMFSVIWKIIENIAFTHANRCRRHVNTIPCDTSERKSLLHDFKLTSEWYCWRCARMRFHIHTHMWIMYIIRRLTFLSVIRIAKKNIASRNPIIQSTQ